MCYARTGIARVGTALAEYLPAARGYLPFDKLDPQQLRVLPCRYSAHVATLAPGMQDGQGPMRFLEPGQKPVAASGLRDKDAGPASAPPLIMQTAD